MLGFIGNIGTWELVFILLVALIVVGPGKLPEVARSFGKALSEFKRTTSGVQKEFQDALKFDDEPKSKVAKTEPVKTDEPSSPAEATVTEANSANNTPEDNDTSVGELIEITESTEINEPIATTEDKPETENHTEHNPYQ